MKHKRIAALFLAVLMIFALTMTVCAEDEATELVEENIEEAVEIPAVEAEPGQAAENESAAAAGATEEKTAFDTVTDYLLDHAVDIGFLGYLLYQILPRVGALAKSRKEKKKFQALLDHYFNDENNSRSVVNILSAGNESMSKFMSDFSPFVPFVKKLDERMDTVEKLIGELCANKELQEKILDAMLACRESVLLMGKQMEAVMMVAGGVGDQKKAEIYAAYAEESRKLNERMAAVVAEKEAPHDTEEKGAYT